MRLVLKMTMMMVIVLSVSIMVQRLSNTVEKGRVIL